MDLPNLPALDIQDRVYPDIGRLVHFISRQPWGKSVNREQDIDDAINMILRGPELNNVDTVRRKSGVALRRHNARQFSIIYVYDPPSDASPNGRVSIRAVRHSRVKNVFKGVRENTEFPYNYFY